MSEVQAVEPQSEKPFPRARYIQEKPIAPVKDLAPGSMDEESFVSEM
jgi:hypothetical protein